MKKNIHIKQLSLLLLASLSLIPNGQTLASESTHSNKLAWVTVLGLTGTSALAYRVYFHRRKASRFIEKVNDDYHGSKPLEELTQFDTYTGDGGTELIIRNYNNGSISCRRSALLPRVELRKLQQSEFPVVLIKKSTGIQFNQIEKQIRRINGYRDPYYDRLALHNENGQRAAAEEEGNSFFSRWCKPLLSSLKSLTHSLYRFTLYPADDIVRNDDLVNSWKVKLDHWSIVKEKLNQDAEEINRRCTHTI